MTESTVSDHPQRERKQTMTMWDEFPEMLIPMLPKSYRGHFSKKRPKKDKKAEKNDDEKKVKPVKKKKVSPKKKVTKKAPSKKKAPKKKAPKKVVKKVAKKKKAVPKKDKKKAFEGDEELLAEVRHDSSMIAIRDMTLV